MTLSTRGRIVVGMIAILGIATTWGLTVSIVASEPAVSRSELPDDDLGHDRGRQEVIVRGGYGDRRGEFGISSAGEMQGPKSFGVDDRERVYVLDNVNHRVTRFTEGAPDADYPLPEGEFEDIVVARDIVCALSRFEKRLVIVIDTASRTTHALPIAESVPPVLRLFVVGEDVVVECPNEAGRTYHTVGDTSGRLSAAADQAAPRAGDTPVPGGGTLEASMRSQNDLALDVISRDGGLRTRLRAHSRRDVAAILDATTDRFGNVYITWALTRDASSPSEHQDGRLVITRHSAQGELTGRIETSHSSEPEPFRKTIVSESGHVYQLVTDRAGVRVVRWTMAPEEE